LKTIFPKWINDLKPVIFLTGGLSVVGIVLIVNFYFTDAHLSVGYAPEQPIPFSHRLHVGELGLDCRYCHVNVEKSPVASVPPAAVCLNCHTKIKTDSPKLKPLFERNPAQATTFKEEVVEEMDAKGVFHPKVIKYEVPNDKANDPIEWIRIHNLPDYAYFDHSVHINANIGCTSCHGRIDQMDVVSQAKPLSMSWCLECHRDYGDHVRPETVPVTKMDWKWESEAAKEENLKKVSEKLNPPEECSACHR